MKTQLLQSTISKFESVLKEKSNSPLNKSSKIFPISQQFSTHQKVNQIESLKKSKFDKKCSIGQGEEQLQSLSGHINKKLNDFHSNGYDIYSKDVIIEANNIQKEEIQYPNIDTYKSILAYKYLLKKKLSMNTPYKNQSFSEKQVENKATPRSKLKTMKEIKTEERMNKSNQLRQKSPVIKSMITTKFPSNSKRRKSYFEKQA